MGWKKEFKKMKKEQELKRSMFDYSDGESSFILWNRSFEAEEFWNVDNLVILMDKFNDEIDEISRFQDFLEGFDDGYTWVFDKKNIREHFFAYPCASKFGGIYNYLLPKVGNFTAALIICALTKYCYYTTDKFWKVINYTFSSVQKQMPIMKRIYEVMQRTTLDALEAIIDKSLLLCNNKEIFAYKNHLVIEEIIDLGDELTFHWSKMLDQVIELTIETIKFEETYGGGFTADETFFDIDDDEEDFFERTKTMVLNDEVDEAFDYFGLTKTANLDTFKKIYRKLAKQYHPDLNPEPSAAIEMKKINVYKNIVEKYIEEFNA